MMKYLTCSALLITAAVSQTENCDWDETTNPHFTSKCSTDDMCRGARVCSKFGWCGGDPECPGIQSCDAIENL